MQWFNFFQFGQCFARTKETISISISHFLPELKQSLTLLIENNVSLMIVDSVFISSLTPQQIIFQ